LLLRGDGLEEADERAQLVRREGERGHAHAQVGAHAVAVLARLRLERARRVRALLTVRAGLRLCRARLARLPAAARPGLSVGRVAPADVRLRLRAAARSVRRGLAS